MDGSIRTIEWYQHDGHPVLAIMFETDSDRLRFMNHLYLSDPVCPECHNSDEPCCACGYEGNAA